MSILFSPYKIGSLELPNRLVRSATAERMADTDGRPLPPLKDLYAELARGGVGLIITGHMYVHPSGKVHEEMTGIYNDDLLPDLAQLANTVHHENGRIVVQINHGGMHSSDETVDETFAPSPVGEPYVSRPAREVTPQEIENIIQAYADAARRVQETGFDGVQIHAAHGYLIGQFLSPLINRRNDEWGGEITKRMRFLKEISRAIREQVGYDYPVLIKLGMMDGIEGGLLPDESLQVVAALEDMGIDGLEISGGLNGDRVKNIKKGIRSEDDEAYFLPLAQEARKVTQLPILLVGGMRSRSVMDRILADGHADFVSMCRPLISEPDLPNRLRLSLQDKSRCMSSNNCWPENLGEGIACKCPHEKLVDKGKT
ncbi:MAG: NADH:flavin oxidoreductase [Anaerolineaceae bacterium]|nr:MAG: NADH:flavin oxidoreductase [Anaerolineaceae bacterium]